MPGFEAGTTAISGCNLPDLDCYIAKAVDIMTDYYKI